MASIRKRRGTFSVVYTYENENGEKKQRWETFKTYAEAHKRRAEIEYKQTEGTFLPPNKQTVADVLKDYVALELRKNGLTEIELKSVNGGESQTIAF